jgi:hypothetical protein
LTVSGRPRTRQLGRDLFDKTAAEAVFGELVASDSTRYLSPCDVAEVLSVLGDRRGCIDWLQRPVDERCAEPVGLQMDSMYDAMRLRNSRASNR